MCNFNKSLCVVFGRRGGNIVYLLKKQSWLLSVLMALVMLLSFVPQALAADPPTVILAEVTTQRDISITFNKPMTNPIQKTTGFTVLLTENQVTIPVTIFDVINTGTANKIKLVLDDPGTVGVNEGLPAGTTATNATIAYTLPVDLTKQVTSAEGGVLASFTAQTVEPNKPFQENFATSTDGTKVLITFNKMMANPAGQESSFSVLVDNVAVPNAVNAAALYDPQTIELTLTNPVTFNQKVEVAYTKGTVHSYASSQSNLDSFVAQIVTNTVPEPDLSAANADLAVAGSKNAEAAFDIAISEAKGGDGNALNGSIGVTVTNGVDTVYSGTPTFTTGSATITIPANIASLTTAGDYTLTVSIVGVTPTPTVPITVIADTQISAANSSAVIDQPLNKGTTRTITVTLKDSYGNLMINTTQNMKIAVTVTDNDATNDESYTVDGTAITSTDSLTRDNTALNGSGQYSFDVTLPASIDPQDGVSVQVTQSDNTATGSVFSFIEIPEISSAVTSSDGSKIILTFIKTIADYSENANKFTVHVGTGTVGVSSLALSADKTEIELTLENAITYGQIVTVDYTPGTITFEEGGQLAVFSGKDVSNTTPEMSAASAALVDAGSKSAGAAFNITISEAKDVYGSAINDSTEVTVTNGADTVYSGTPSFTAGSATVTIPANTTSLTAAGDYTLTVSLEGVTPTPTVPVTIIAATQISSAYSSAEIDQPLAKGITRTVTVTLKDAYENLIINTTKNMKIAVTVVSSNVTTTENYTVDGTSVNATIVLTRANISLNGSGQYSFDVTLPAIVDPGDGVSVLVTQNNDTAVGSAFAFSEPGAAPVLNSVSSTTNGSKIILAFDKTMSDPSGNAGQFTVHAGSGTVGVNTAALNADTAKIELILATAIAYGQNVTLDYTPGTVVSADGGELASFSGQSVTNNVPATPGVPLVALPIVTTGVPSGTGGQKDAATFSGTVKSDDPVTECGIVYSSSHNPTIGNATKVIATNVTATTEDTKSFTATVDLSGLTEGVLYYTRSYAVNSAGVGYGQEEPFTVGQAPVLMGVYLTTTNYLTETNLEDQKSTPGISIMNNNNVPSGSQTIDIYYNKNIIADAIYANNRACITLKDITNNSDVPISVFRIGLADYRGVYKNHLYFDVDLQSGTSYQIIIDKNLEANNGSILGTQKTIDFKVSGISAGLTTGPKPSETPLVSVPVSAGTGGTVQANDGTQVIIPAGAIGGSSTSLEIAIYEDTQSTDPTTTGITSYNQLYSERSFGPSGTQFLSPVTLVIPFNLANIPATDYPYLSVYLWQNGRWVKVGGVVDPVTRTVSVTVSHFSTYRIMADKTASSVRIGGTDRYDTAVKIAQNNFATGADTVILARGDVSADSLTAVPLAKFFNAPLLLTPQGYLPSQVLNEIKALKAKKVYIVGGEQVVSAKVAQAINAQGITVLRVSGKDRYTTAYEVAKLMGNTGQAVIVNGNNNAYPDALSISSWAAWNGVPILYSDGTNVLPLATAQALTEFKVTRTILVGGTGVLPVSLEKLVPSPERYAGTDRYGTNVAVLTKLQAKPIRIYGVTGTNFADALAGAAVAGQSNSWILLTGSTQNAQDGLTADQLQMVQSCKGIVLDLHIFGGTGAVPDTVLNGLKTSLGL